jgi:hypothetical protein
MAFHDDELDQETANRLLAGRVVPDDAPPGYREVTQLLHEARLGNGLSYVPDDAVIVAIVDAVTSPERIPRSRKHMLTRIVTTKAAVASAVVALSATGAAAATGSLPDVAQNGLARAAEHVGINLPDNANDKAREATQKDSEQVEDEVPASSDDASDDAVDSGAPATISPTNGDPVEADKGAADDAPADDVRADAATPPASGNTNDNHGAVVADTAHNADPADGKGEEVAPVARDNHGAEVRADKPTNPSAENGQSGDEHGTPAAEANGHAIDNAGQPHGNP